MGDLNLNKSEIQKIHIYHFPQHFDEFDIIDKTRISEVTDNLNSLNIKKTLEDPGKYIGGGYILKLSLNSGIERTIFLSGNMFLLEKNNFTYKIPYEEAIKFDTIVASILEENQSKMDEVSIIGTVNLINKDSSGRNISCNIKAEDNINYSVDLSNAKIVDATGSGWLILHENDVIKVFYPKGIQTSEINATLVFIKASSNETASK
jgi:hypothetical protein